MGTCAASLGTMQAAMEGQQVVEALTKIAFQMVTRPKIHTEWPTTGDLYQAEEDFRHWSVTKGLVGNLPVTSIWESMTTIHQWRARGPLEMS